MGQKVSPISLREFINKITDSRWIAGKKDYAGKEFTTTDMNAIAKYVAEQDKLAANKALADAQNAGYNAAMGELEGMVQSAISPIQQMYSNMQSFFALLPQCSRLDTTPLLLNTRISPGSTSRITSAPTALMAQLSEATMYIPSAVLP